MIFALFMVVSGGLMAYMASIKGKFVPGVDMTQPRHPVTPEMAKQVGKLNQKVGKFFKLPDTTGKPTLIGGAGPKPQFIYFIKDECPCSFEAEPILQNLYKHFEGKIDFIAVTDANMEDAKHWVKDLKVPYPVVTNPKLDVMESYQAPNSVYNSLLDQNGVIVKRWAGYSKEYLLEMNEEMSKLLGLPVKPFDTQYAPLEKTSGCSFEGYKEQKQ